MNVRVFIDRKELTGYTSLTLARQKDQFTGTLNLSVFMGRIPDEPIFVDATKGREILVYIGSFLAFTGIIDRRGDKSQKAEGASQSLSIGADSYTVSFAARGKTKYLIDSSHRHATGTLKRTSNRRAFAELIEPWGITLDWQADDIDLDRVRLRDGGRVVDELQRIANQCSLYMHETANGQLRVTDKAGEVAGEAIVLGVNILSFSTEQAEDADRSEITVKGQRQEVNQWGIPAVIPTLETVANSLLENLSPVTVQLFGNATPELIKRRGQYEANRRSAASKRVQLDVFHVQQTTGQPWDIGTLHYVEIPPAGVADVLEVIELTYTVEPDKTLKTTLTLSPPPASSANGAQAAFMGAAGAAPSGRGKPISPAGAWAGPSLKASAAAGASASSGFLGGVSGAASVPPNTLRGV